ncbi:Uncharacterised protein [Providencia rustigianii]|nr:Uncharacterised protein [Providencia rustigianii]
MSNNTRIEEDLLGKKKFQLMPIMVFILCVRLKTFISATALLTMSQNLFVAW